jgi:hypothetical protein
MGCSRPEGVESRLDEADSWPEGVESRLDEVIHGQKG